MIKLVTDTTCDMPAAWLAQYNITQVPINITFGLEGYLEGETITAETFYHRIETEQELPTTSQPSVGRFNEVYNKLGADGSDILSIHVTSQLSGTCQTASLSAKQNPDLTIHVLDSWTGSTGLGLMIREAARFIEAGLPAAAIVSRLEARRPQIKTYIMLNDLRYARLSGRVGRLRETLVSLLNIKPIIGTNQGALVPVDRVRTKKKGFARMLELAKTEHGDKPVHIGMAHALAEAEAEDLLGELKNCLNCRDTFVAEVALSLAVHFGPGTVGFAVYPAD